LRPLAVPVSFYSPSGSSFSEGFQVSRFTREPEGTASLPRMTFELLSHSLLIILFLVVAD